MFKKVVLTYHSADAASTDGGLELAVQLLDSTGCVEALGEQDDPVQEEKRSDAIDDILHQLYSVKEEHIRVKICGARYKKNSPSPT